MTPDRERDLLEANNRYLEQSRQALRALKIAVGHLEHMAAFIGRQGAGYSFEGLGEDMGAIKAAKNAGRSDQFLFGGMDLSPQGLDAIEAGTYTVSFGGHWLQGGFGLAILYAKIKNGTSPSQPVVKLDLLAVTKDNVAEFRKKYIDNPPNYDFKAMVTDPSPKYQITLGS